MIFLKKFYASGFKSFADPIQIEFTKPMTGIVGPNGAGKSNIVDAFKWVLGEQSIKDMRGNSKFDLIFKGSTNRDESKFAHVVLTFDNSLKVLHSDETTVSISRKLFRESGDSEYKINNQIARLKDIQLIFTDTGLSKGSLGIISQGTVNTFSDSKPEARRKLFEDAAGIGMYSTKKAESLRNLEKAETNLVAIQTVENELLKDLKKLNRQAETAKIYLEKSKKLKDIELTIFVKDIKKLNENINKLNDTVKVYQEDKIIFEPQVEELRAKILIIKEKLSEADKDNHLYNEKVFEHNEKINSLEKKQLLIDSNLEKNLNASDVNTRINSYKQLIDGLTIDINNSDVKIEESKIQIETFTDILNELQEKDYHINLKQSDVINSLTEFRTTLKFILEQLNSSNNQNFGINAILNNKAGISGVHDTILNLIEVDEKYEKAIMKAFGSTINNLIVDNSENAKNAIKFLKNNKAGKATFLPISDIKSRFIKTDDVNLLNNLEGYEGIAGNLVKVNEKYVNIINSLVGQVIISDNIENALRISKFINKAYKIITLDGDVVFAGGAIAGGYDKKSNFSILNVEKNKKELSEKIIILEKQKISNQAVIDKLKYDINDVNEKINEKNHTLSIWSTIHESNKTKREHYVIEFEILSEKKYEKNSIDSNDLKEEINKFKSLLFKAKENNAIAITAKNKYQSELRDSEGKLEDLRKKIDSIKDELYSEERNLIKANGIIDSIKNKINEKYKLTLEFVMENYLNELPMTEVQAREIIRQLNSEIDTLGAINFNAIDELTEKESKCSEITQSREEIEKSVNDIRQSILSLDKAAKSKFLKIISDVNKNLPEIFRFLFGGGTCAITLSDEENVLESGIEIMANPPGKRISNLKLLSGGEKTLVAISVLFTILKISSFPMVILDEAEAALDLANVERFAKIIKKSGQNTQFLVITHRPGTMKECDTLLGATMQTPGITKMISVELEKAIKTSEEES